MVIQDSEVRTEASSESGAVTPRQDYMRLEEAMIMIRENGGLVASDPSQLNLWIFVQSKAQLAHMVQSWKSNDAQHNPFHPANGLGQTSKRTMSI